MMENLPSVETLRAKFRYDAQTGGLFWRDRDRNLSGLAAGSMHSQHRKWCASISVNRKVKTIGIFVEIADAIAARRNAEIEFGYHQNHGREKS